MVAKYPAAFINAIADDGTKEDAIEYLQQTWDELQTLKAALVKKGYTREYLDNACLSKRPAWRDR